MGAITNEFLANIDMARLQRAVRGLEEGTLSVVLNGQTEGAVWGQVRNGGGKAYSVQVAHGFASCSCPDWAYRHRDGLEACKKRELVNEPEVYAVEPPVDFVRELMTSYLHLLPRCGVTCLLRLLTVGL